MVKGQVGIAIEAAHGQQEAVGAPRGYRHDIQVLRGIAVVLVVVYHSGVALPGGFVGVDVFLVISGYVITAMLLREFDETGRVSLANFYRRRIRRLLPALAVVLIVTVGLSILFQNPGGAQQTTAKTAVAAALVGSNVMLARDGGGYFDDSAETNPLLHTWSLSVEEQFYLGFPLLFLFALRLIRSRKPALVTTVATLCVGSFILSLAVGRGSVVLPLFGSSPAESAFYSPITRAWEFGLGILAALALARWPRVRVPTRWAWSLGLTLIFATALIERGATFSAFNVTPAVAGATLICLAGTPILRSQRARKPVTTSLGWLGDRSYGWYLWHWPLMVFTTAIWSPRPALLLIVGAVSLLPAMASYRWVESPLRQSRGSKRQTLVIAVGCISLPLGAGLALAQGSQYGWGQDWALGSHEVMRRDCDTGTIDPVRCLWSHPEALGTVALVGDSQAWAVGNGVIEANSQNRRSTAAFVRNGCPFLTSPVPTVSEVCTSWSHEVLARLRILRPEIVVIANNSIGYVQTPDDLSGWADALRATIRDVHPVGRGVVVIGVIPQGDGEAADMSLLLRPDRPRSTVRALQPQIRALVERAERRVIGEIPNTVWFDPADVLCDADMCRTATVSSELYVDGNHLSRAGALLLTDDLSKATDALLR